MNVPDKSAMRTEATPSSIAASSVLSSLKRRGADSVLESGNGLVEETHAVRASSNANASAGSHKRRWAEPQLSSSPERTVGQTLMIDLREAEMEYKVVAENLLRLDSSDPTRQFATTLVELKQRHWLEKKEAARRAGLLPDSSDPTRQFATTLVELKQKHWVEKREAARRAGILPREVSDSSALHVSDGVCSLSLKKVLKRTPRWDPAWDNDQDLDVFLIRMTMVKDMVLRGRRVISPLVAEQIWLAAIDELISSGYVLTSPFSPLQSWEQMEESFCALLPPRDVMRHAYRFEELVWGTDMPIGQFCMRFKSAAASCGLCQPDASDEFRLWLAYRFVRNFPPTWTFGELFFKDRPPTLEELMDRACVEKRLHPSDTGTGQIQRPATKNGRLQHPVTRMSWIRCFECGELGHFRSKCPERTAARHHAKKFKGEDQ
ncbi:hypothetical protein BGZ98_001865 [Dissophora globulifera]|nr:hypothetical protein BGZ98_001865 [Dissophora globulifera]